MPGAADRLAAAVTCASALSARRRWCPAPDPAPARYVLVMGARIYALIQALHASHDRDPGRIRQPFEAHGAKLLE
jgi:hypothetical protein